MQGLAYSLARLCGQLNLGAERELLVRAAPGPMYGWWPAPPHQVQHMGFPKPPYQQAHPMPMPPAFSGPQNSFSPPMQRSQLPPGSSGYMRPRSGPPMHGGGPRGIPRGLPQMQSAGSGGWMVPQQGTYSCEVRSANSDINDVIDEWKRWFCMRCHSLIFAVHDDDQS